MPKYRINIQVDEYMQYVVECSSADEARKRGLVDFEMARMEATFPGFKPTITVSQVADNVELGDF